MSYAYVRNVRRRMVAARSNCHRFVIAVEWDSDDGRIEVVTTA